MVKRKLSKIYDNLALKLLSQQQVTRYDRALVIKYYGDMIVGGFLFLSICFYPEMFRSLLAFLKFCSIFIFVFGMIELGVKYFQAKCFGLCSPKPIHVMVHPLRKDKPEPYKLEFMNPKLSNDFQVLYNFN